MLKIKFIQKNYRPKFQGGKVGIMSLKEGILGVVNCGRFEFPGIVGMPGKVGICGIVGNAGMVGIAGIDGILLTRSPKTSHGPLAGRQSDEPEKLFFNIKSVTFSFFRRLNFFYNFYNILISI